MKIVALTILSLFFFFALGTFSLISLNILFARAGLAEEYKPADFLDSNDKFEVIVGIDKIEGPYFTYHYEFNE